MTELIIKLIFLFSMIPFLVSEKIQQKFDLRINPQVVDTLFSSPSPVGEMENKEIDEASGLVASRKFPGILYTHNDSGGKPYVYMIDTLGKSKGKILLYGVKNRDWEDIAIGPGMDPSRSYIYVGEIGDNQAKYEQIYIYRFPEPQHLQEEIIVKPEKLTFQYPDGPKDAETLLVDPWNGDLFILSKRDSSNVLYRAKAEDLGTGVIMLEKLHKLPITLSVGGDISPDGKHILIKNYWVVYYWERKEGETIPEALSKKPVMVPYNPEPQGEAIAFFENGNGYFTLSEKKLRVQPILYRYEKK